MSTPEPPPDPPINELFTEAQQKAIKGIADESATNISKTTAQTIVTSAVSAAIISVLATVGIMLGPINDRLDALEATPTPTPTVTVTPTVTPPTPTATVTPPSPTPVPLPGPTPSGPGGGVFSVTCLFDHRAGDDPLVFPGVAGAAHQHDFFGSVGVNPSSTASSIAAAGTTCLHTGDHAAYWAPALVVQGCTLPSNCTYYKPKSVFAYYQTTNGAPARAFPAGLAMIADAAVDPSGKSGFSCSDQGPFTPQPGNCPNKVVGHIHFPDCWDGVHLDSANHRSHMSYSKAGVCDAAHPVRLVQLRMHVQYVGLTNGAQYRIGPNPDGTFPALHADFVNGWQPGVLERILTNCINAGVMCKQSTTI